MSGGGTPDRSGISICGAGNAASCAATAAGSMPSFLHEAETRDSEVEGAEAREGEAVTSDSEGFRVVGVGRVDEEER